MSNQTQATATIPSLATLLQHPDFQAGVAEAEEGFDKNHGSTLNEDEMIDEVETNLTRAIVDRSRLVAASLGEQHPSYIHHLGFVLGTINKGLTYASITVSRDECYA